MWCSDPPAPAPGEEGAPAAPELFEFSLSCPQQALPCPGQFMPLGRPSLSLQVRVQGSKGPLRAFPDTLRGDSSFPSGSHSPSAAPTAHGVHWLPIPSQDTGLPVSVTHEGWHGMLKEQPHLELPFLSRDTLHHSYPGAQQPPHRKGGAWHGGSDPSVRRPVPSRGHLCIL